MQRLPEVTTKEQPMSYRETFVTLPVTSQSGDEELTIPAHKVQAIRGNAKSAIVTYKDGETIERVAVALSVVEVRTLVMEAMTDWA
jgi:hypothetical protein